MKSYNVNVGLARRVNTVSSIIADVDAIARKGGANSFQRKRIKGRLARAFDETGYLSKGEVGAEIALIALHELEQKTKPASERANDMITQLKLLQKVLPQHVK